MGGRERNGLTEPMFYILMALLGGDKCGLEVLDFIYNCSEGRVTVWPGTLYTVLGKFERQGLIRGTEEDRGEGCKRVYAITERGRLLYEGELLRLHDCMADARRAMSFAVSDIERELDDAEEEA